MSNFQSNILQDSHICHDKNATLFDIFFGMPNFCRCLKVKLCVNLHPNGPKIKFGLVYCIQLLTIINAILGRCHAARQIIQKKLPLSSPLCPSMRNLRFVNTLTESGDDGGSFLGMIRYAAWLRPYE